MDAKTKAEAIKKTIRFLTSVARFDSIEDVIDKAVKVEVEPHPYYTSGNSKWVATVEIVLNPEAGPCSKVSFPNAPCAATKRRALAAGQNRGRREIESLEFSLPTNAANVRQRVSLAELVDGGAAKLIQELGA